MKTKKFDKKLVLNKKTIAHLGNDEMKKAQGGFKTIGTCATLDATACTVRPCCNTIQDPCGP